MKICKYTDYQGFIRDLETDEISNRKSGSTYFDLVENEIGEDVKTLSELIDTYHKIAESLENLVEQKSVFDKVNQLLSTGGLGGKDQRNNNNLNDFNDDHRVSQIDTLAGVIKAEDELKMKRMIFRISRGRAIPTFFDLEVEQRHNVFYY